MGGLARAASEAAGLPRANGLELSTEKSVCTAGTDKLIKAIETKWKDIGITYKRRVKSLGVGLGWDEEEHKQLWEQEEQDLQLADEESSRAATKAAKAAAKITAVILAQSFSNS